MEFTITTFSRKQLSEKYGITRSQWERRKQELLAHLKEYMDIEEYTDKNGYFFYDIVGKVPDSIPPMSRKSYTTEKTLDYEKFVLENLPTEPTLETKTNMSDMAIKEIGRRKWNHNSVQAVARRYVGPAMEKYGQKSDHTLWAEKSNISHSYRALDQEELDALHKCFETVKLPPEEWAARYKEVMEDEAEYKRQSTLFKQALELFSRFYGFKPVLAYKWMIKPEWQNNKLDI